MTKTNSNFGKYFRYKLGKRKSSMIIFAVLNFLSLILPCIISFNYYSQLKNEIKTSTDGFIMISGFSRTCIFFMVVSSVICMIMITITTVKSLKIYHDRAARDTLCSLPLSYGERFWGDFLSNICVNLISFVPLSIVMLIITNSMKPLIQYLSNNDFSFLVDINMPRLISDLVPVLALIYFGIYAVTTFITSCCGKFGSSVLFSFVAWQCRPEFLRLTQIISSPL